MSLCITQFEPQELREIGKWIPRCPCAPHNLDNEKRMGNGVGLETVPVHDTIHLDIQSEPGNYPNPTKRW